MAKLRSEIEEKYKWDLSKLYGNMDVLNKDVDLIMEYHKKLLGFKGHIMESGKSFYDFYQIYMEYKRVSDRVWLYCCLNYDQDTKNQKSLALKLRVEKIEDGLDSQLSFKESEIISKSYQKVQEMIKDYPKLQDIKIAIDDLFRCKDHILTKVEEELIAKANMAMDTSSQVFKGLNDNDLKFEAVIDAEGQKLELNETSYKKLLNNPDRNIRKQTFEKYYTGYSDLKNAFAATYRGQVKKDHFNSEVRGYNSPLEESLYADNIDKSVCTNLVDTVHDNMKYMYDYIDLKRKVLGIDELHMYDVYLDLCSADIKSVPFEEGKNIILEALKPLGEEYLKNLNRAFNERWIDIYPNDGKKSGAYNWGEYNTNAYVLLNYNDTIYSVSALAHELGHSMHSCFSNKQPYISSKTPIFLAEIASTTNEMLLNDYLYKNAKTIEEKKLYLSNFLERIRTTLYRQTMFAEFEMMMHDKYANDIALTEDEMSNTYYELNKLYFGDNIVVDDAIRYEWMGTPHFYRPFYVYKYATGISIATAFASDIINNVNGARERYIEFLSSGCSDYPLNILKNAGVDMSTPKPIQKCLDMFDEKIKEYKKLI